MLNYDCFEKIAMLGDSKKSVQVRDYFCRIKKIYIWESSHNFPTIEQQRFIEKI